MKVEYSIRGAMPEDARGIGLILQPSDTLHRFADQDEKMSFEQIAERIADHLREEISAEDHRVYVAESDQGDLLGYAAVHWIAYLFFPGTEGYVSELFVHPAARGAGIGTALLERAVQEARQRGYTRLSLLNMRQRESYQRGFYTRRGWIERPEAANFVLNCSKRSR